MVQRAEAAGEGAALRAARQSCDWLRGPCPELCGRGDSAYCQESCRLGQALTGLLGVFQLLDCVDFEQHIDDCILNLLESHMHSQSSVLRRMAVTSLVLLSTRPKTVSGGIWAKWRHPPGAGLQALLPAEACLDFARNREGR